MMHKEIVVRRKMHVIVLALLVITVMLYVQQALKLISFDNNKTPIICKIMLLSITTLIIVRECISCNVSYKYALIANKFIINKTFSKGEKTLVSVKISDIVYIVKKNDKLKKYNAKLIGNYTFNRLITNQCCCIYRINGDYYKFYFKPSDYFIRRIMQNTKYSYLQQDIVDMEQIKTQAN